MGRKKKGEPVHGWLILDKPRGMGSTQAVGMVKRVLRQMAPALLGVSVAQLSILINTQIASHQGVGAVSWLTYADRLMEFPTALLGVALLRMGLRRGGRGERQRPRAQAEGDVLVEDVVVAEAARVVALAAAAADRDGPGRGRAVPVLHRGAAQGSGQAGQEAGRGRQGRAPQRPPRRGPTPGSPPPSRR